MRCIISGGYQGLHPEVVSSLEDCQGWEQRETPQMLGEPISPDVQPPGSRTPRGRDASKERSLAKVREAHHSALVVADTLEEETEWLSYPLIWSQSETWTHSCSRDCCRHSSRGQKRRHCQVWLEDCCAPYFKYNPSSGSSEPSGEEAATKDLDLGEPPELVLEVTYFLQGSAESLGEVGVKAPSPKPPIEDLQKWVTWEGPDMQNTQLVARVLHGAWGGQLWKAGTWGTGFFLIPKEGEWTMLGEEQPSGTACTAMSSSEELLAATRFYLCLSGYPGNSTWEDGGICLGPSVLGGEG